MFTHVNACSLFTRACRRKKKETPRMAENEKELLLSDRETQVEDGDGIVHGREERREDQINKEDRIRFKEEEEEVAGNKGYKECDPNCKCGGACKKCVHQKSKCVSGCGCERCKRFAKTRINQICVGAANVFQGRLRFLLYMILLVLLITFLLIFLFVILFIFLHHNGVSKPPAPKPSKLNGVVAKRNSLCKEITPENCSLFIMGYVDASTEKAKKFIDPTKNVFYVLDKPLSHQQACNVESLLRLLADKLVYILEFNKNSAGGDKDYINYLQRRYVNLNRIKTNQTHFFEGSLFENNWRNSSKALTIFAAKILSIWQFGGLAISENILMNSRDIIDESKDICFSDIDITFCPQECSAYTYELMKVILNEMKSPPPHGDVDILEKIIDNSINDFCSGDVAKIGCNRVYRLSKSDMCEDETGPCQFMRMKTLEQLVNHNNMLKEFCPYMMTHQ